MGRPPLGDRAMTAAERQRRRRSKLKGMVNVASDATPMEIVSAADARNRVPELWDHCAAVAAHALQVMEHIAFDDAADDPDTGRKRIKSLQRALAKASTECRPRGWE